MTRSLLEKNDLPRSTLNAMQEKSIVSLHPDNSPYLSHPLNSDNLYRISNNLSEQVLQTPGPDYKWVCVA